MTRRPSRTSLFVCASATIITVTMTTTAFAQPPRNPDPGQPVLIHELDEPLNPAGSTSPAISSSYRHSCALVGGTVQCWGRNSYGQLGNGTTTNSGTPVTVSGITNATAVTTGDSHSCALLANSTVKCWGRNTEGRLGDGTTIDRPTPVVVGGLSDATAIAAGDYHSCALRSAGSVVCWGSNSDGQLGDATTTDRTSPVAVSGLSGVSNLALGAISSCALRVGGTVRCWGSNIVGQLGNATTTSSSVPVAVSLLTDAATITANLLHVCVARTGGTVACWGYNAFGQLGNGSTTNSSTPALVNGISDAIGVAAGWFHTCALRPDGSVYCWGYNFYGHLGDATFVNRLTPSRVALVNDAVAVSAGAYTTCFTNAGGGRYCIGRNISGENGNGYTGSFLPNTTFEALGGQLERLTLSVNSLGQAELYGLNSAGNVYRRVRYATNNWSAWEQLSGQLRRIAATTTDTGRTVIIGVNDANEIYYRYQTTPGGALSNWARLPGALRTITIAGSDQNDIVYIAGINNNGNVYSLYLSFTGTTATPSAYYTLPGILTEITINGNGDITGVSPAGNIYTRFYNDTTSAWGFTSGTLSRIAAERGEAGNIYAGTNAAQAIYVRANGVWNFIPGQLTDIALASMPNGGILLAGINASGNPYITTL